jgi:Fe-S-cluster containining protein
MRFDPIPQDAFAEFHRSFRGDTPETFTVCARCEGACEYNKIGTLMPGEREYMAAAAGLSVDEFRSRFLDTVEMPGGVELDVLRLINGCPFLDRGTFECNCRAFKVVLCEIYPIGFSVVDGEVRFSIDDWCPISDTLRFRRHFIEAGVAAVSKLPVPVAWYEQVALYDDLYFDYYALEATREERSKPKAFTFEELVCFQRAGLEHDPKERYHPFPLEVVSYRVPPRVASAGVGGRRGAERRKTAAP